MSDVKGHEITFGAKPRLARVVVGGLVVAESRNAVLLQEGNLPAVCYFPRDDIAVEHLTPTDHRSFCPFKGEASYWSLRAGGRVEENAAWAYEDPLPEVSRIKGLIAFYADRVDAQIIDHGDR